MFTLAVAAAGLAAPPPPADNPYFGFRFAPPPGAGRLVVTKVDEKGLAAQIGLRPDDRLVTIEGAGVREDIKDEAALHAALKRVEQAAKAGDGPARVAIVVERPGGAEPVTLRGEIRRTPAAADRKKAPAYVFLPTDKNWKVDVSKIKSRPPLMSRPAGKP